MSSNIISAAYTTGSTSASSIADSSSVTILGKALNVGKGINTIAIYSGGDSNAKLINFNVGATLATYLASGTTTINGGKIHAGSNIKIGNMDGASDYCEITNGDITFHKYFSTLGHKPTKSLKRLEVGTATSGVEKELPGWWAETPQVFVSPMSIQTYIKDSGSQNQILNCLPPTPYQKSEGKWAFVPQMMLIASAADGMGNIMPINYTDMIVDDAYYLDPLGTVVGTEYYVTESNIVAMTARVNLRGVYDGDWPHDDSYTNVQYYARIGFYIINTWHATDWVLIAPGTSADELWAWGSYTFNIPGQTDEISKIRVEVKPYDGTAYSCRNGRFYKSSTRDFGLHEGSPYLGYLFIESTLVSYAGAYGADSVVVAGDVNYIAVSAG